MHEVTTWYLDMSAASELRKAAEAPAEYQLSRLPSRSAARARELYAQIGGSLDWNDRRSWSDLAWAAHAARPNIGLYVLERGHEPLGFFELEQGPQGDVLLAYLGLVSRARGVGLGGSLLTRAVETAWQKPATKRLWLRTSSLDSPRALPNYLARGFRIAGRITFQC